MSGFDFDIDSAINELDRLARNVSDSVPGALDAMSTALVPKIRDAAPFDTMNSYDDHLKDLIVSTKTKMSKNGNPYQLIKVKKRGYKDKHVFKAVVGEWGRDNPSQNLRNSRRKNGTERMLEAEYGTSRLKGTNFWSKAVRENREETIAAGKKVIEEAIEKSKGK